MSVAARKQHEVPGPQTARRSTLDGHIALTLDHDMHTAQPRFGEGDPKR